jgi:hypothetical protein
MAEMTVAVPTLMLSGFAGPPRVDSTASHPVRVVRTASGSFASPGTTVRLGSVRLIFEAVLASART